MDPHTELGRYGEGDETYVGARTSQVQPYRN